MTKPKYTTEELKELASAPYRDLNQSERVAVKQWKLGKAGRDISLMANDLLKQNSLLSINSAYEMAKAQIGFENLSREAREASPDPESEKTDPVAGLLPEGFKFVDKLPDDLAAPHRGGMWRTVAALLKSSGGRWMKTQECAKRGLAQDRALRIRHARIKAFLPRGSFDAVVVENPKGVHTVYARYVGADQ